MPDVLVGFSKLGEEGLLLWWGRGAGGSPCARGRPPDTRALADVLGFTLTPQALEADLAVQV